MINRPDFIYNAGSALMHSPLQLKQANMHGFFIKGELTNLQATIDDSLNKTASGRMQFKALSPYVLTTFTRVNHANSSVAVDKEKGWITEIDIITWIMTGKMDEHGKIQHVYWYPCHVFVDSSMALINGRELFGYPKDLCEYVIPEQDSDQLDCSVKVQGFKTFSEDTEIAMHPLLEVNATNPGKPNPVTSFIDFLIQAFDVLKSLPDFLDYDLEAWEDVISLLIHPRIDQIFLKQFPDSAGEKAVYQAILHAPANVNAFHSGEISGHEFKAKVHAFDSFPLDKSLGFPLGESAAVLAFNLNFDFTVTPGEELIDNSQLPPEKIAILGGGVGSMTTAYYLTSQPNWQEKYDITVYQMGWRLGGKGASGRNAEYGDRIEEHGLHIWFGFYENAFAMIKQAYAALDRPDGAPLAKWDDAFKPHDLISLAENIDGETKPWSLLFPKLPGIPGDGTEHITLWQMCVATWGWIKQWLSEIHSSHLKNETLALSPPGQHQSWLHKLADHVEHDVEELGADITLTLHSLHQFIDQLSDDFQNHSEEHHSLISDALKDIKLWLEEKIEHLIDSNDELRRLYICIDLGIAILTGMIADHVLKNGFDVINDIDFRAWLIKHGASKTAADSAPVRGFYDLVFAYVDGEFSQPNIEAGTMLRAMMRIAVCYKGSIMYKMQAGMGDTIFTPMYQVLQQRGVKFKYFHKVEELIPDGNEISEIKMTQQVAVNAGTDYYQPFVYVKGLACWPSQPNYAQLSEQQAKLLQENNINLESNWSNWPDIYKQHFGKELPQVSLKKGQDFDKIVFGISIAGIPEVASQLLPLSPALKTTCSKVKTVVTQAYQVWLDKDLKQMGWDYQPEGQEPVLSAFSEPYDTWAPMDQLLCRENWPAQYSPKNVSYFCSAMPVKDFPPTSDHDFPAKQKQLAKENAIEQLKYRISGLWPNVSAENGFNWDWLIDQNPDAKGEARFDSQYWRANVDPSERYVLSVVNSTKHRIAADGTGFSNLYATGDWIKTGINAGCVEAAVMSGMQTSRVISGYPEKIKGETDL